MYLKQHPSTLAQERLWTNSTYCAIIMLSLTIPAVCYKCPRGGVIGSTVGSTVGRDACSSLRKYALAPSVLRCCPAVRGLDLASCRSIPDDVSWCYMFAYTHTHLLCPWAGAYHVCYTNLSRGSSSVVLHWYHAHLACRVRGLD